MRRLFLADRLFSGDLPPERAPYELRRVAALVAIAREPGVATEMSGAELVVPELTGAVRRESATVPSPRRRRSPMRLRSGKLVLVLVAASATGGVAAAATGALPTPVQHAVARGLAHVGISIPDPTGARQPATASSGPVLLVPTTSLRTCSHESAPTCPSRRVAVPRGESTTAVTPPASLSPTSVGRAANDAGTAPAPTAGRHRKTAVGSSHPTSMPSARSTRTSTTPSRRHGPDRTAPATTGHAPQPVVSHETVHRTSTGPSRVRRRSAHRRSVERHTGATSTTLPGRLRHAARDFKSAKSSTGTVPATTLASVSPPVRRIGAPKGG